MAHSSTAAVGRRVAVWRKCFRRQAKRGNCAQTSMLCASVMFKIPSIIHDAYHCDWYPRDCRGHHARLSCQSSPPSPASPHSHSPDPELRTRPIPCALDLCGQPMMRRFHPHAASIVLQRGCACGALVCGGGETAPVCRLCTVGRGLPQQATQHQDESVVAT